MDGDKRYVALNEKATFSSSLSLGLKLLKGTTLCPPPKKNVWRLGDYLDDVRS